MQSTQFSVCMCVYHRDDPAWFAAAVDSILAQTVPPSEIVLVVDGPVYGELNATIERYEQMAVFRVIRLPENRGHGIARRTGLENCSYELVALMDADDLSVPDRFEKQLAAFESDAEVAIVGGQIAEFIEAPEKTVGYRTVPLTDGEIKEYLKTRCPFNQVTVMFKKSAVMAVGGFLDWYCNEDYYLWNRMFLAGMQFANVADILVNVRVGEDMYQRRGGWKYFVSEFKMQNYMRKNRIIGPLVYAVNVAKRFVVQVLLPNKVRGFVFKKFARTHDAMNEYEKTGN